MRIAWVDVGKVYVPAPSVPMWQVCLLEEGHKLIKIDVLKKFISKKEIKKLKKVSTGERVSFEKLKDISEFFWQVELKGVKNLVKKIPSS